MKQNITIINGNKHIDARGHVKFFNDFSFKKIKRFYEVKNSTKNPVRAFHGHMKEEKYVLPVQGDTLVCVVKITSPLKPSKKTKVRKFVLSEKKPQILHIPSGYANGIKSLSKDSRVIFFSTSTLKQSLKDDFRFEPDYWGDEIWQS